MKCFKRRHGQVERGYPQTSYFSFTTRPTCSSSQSSSQSSSSLLLSPRPLLSLLLVRLMSTWWRSQLEVDARVSLL